MKNIINIYKDIKIFMYNKHCNCYIYFQINNITLKLI